MEHAVQLICFLNYLPCEKLQFASVLRPSLVRLCFGYFQYEFMFYYESVHFLQRAFVCEIRRRFVRCH